MGNVWLHVYLLSKDIGIMIASLHICGSVRTDQLWLYIFKCFHIAELPICVCQHFVFGLLVTSVFIIGNTYANVFPFLLDTFYTHVCYNKGDEIRSYCI